MLRWAEIRLDRLTRNYQKVKRLAGKKRVIAVVKADAYGHGSVKVSQTLQESTDVFGFAVATYEEGRELREAGIEKPILVMASSLSEGKREAVELNLTPVVFDFEELKALNDASYLDVGSGRIAMTTDSYVVKPLFFPGGNLGKLSVSGTVNDLVVSGAVPLYLSAYLPQNL